MIRSIKKKVTAKLREITPNVFSEKADDNALHPYIVFSFPSAPYREGLYSGFLDVDVWDRGDSSAIVDDTSDRIMKDLDCYHFITEDAEATLYLSNVMTVESDDKTLRRKTVIFEIHFRRIN